MGMESATKFIERMKADKVFAREIMDCKDIETRMALALEKGFDFKVEDIVEMEARMYNVEWSGTCLPLHFPCPGIKGCWAIGSC